MKSFAIGTFAAAVVLLAAQGVHAVETEFRVEADERVTVGHYRWALGKVCYSLTHDDGSEATVKMWSLGLGRLDQRSYRGSACFPVVGFARIRAGYTDGRPVNIRVAADHVAGLPYAGGAR